MLYDVAQHHSLKVAPSDFPREQIRGDDLEAQDLPGVAGGKDTRLYPDGLPSAIPRLGKEETDPAAEVEKSTSLDVALNVLQDGSGRGALTRLFANVVP